MEGWTNRMKEIVIATTNPGKVREFQDAFFGLGIRILMLPNDAHLGVPVEDADTFHGNAKIKVEYYGSRLALPVLADDSGLSVEALDGAPGVHSARFAGDHASDAENNQKLIEALENRGLSVSPAAYRCVLAYRDIDGTILFAEGRCSGEVRTTPRGEGGFGYDPYFYLSDGRSMAELTLDEKQAVSHRGEAIRKIKVQIK